MGSLGARLAAVVETLSEDGALQGMYHVGEGLRAASDVSDVGVFISPDTETVYQFV
jgi:hypothetical protein